MARVEAAVACLQELAALPVNEAAALQPQGMPPPMVVASGASRPPPPQPSQTPKPIRPLMTLQPRPQFASLHSYRPPNPTLAPAAAPAPTEPPPPGVDVSDFTSDVFDDLQKFESALMQASANPPPESFAAENAFAEDERNMDCNDAEGGEPQFEENWESCGTVGLLGDAPQELEADDGNFADDTEYNDTSGGYNEFSGNCRPMFPERHPVRDALGSFGGNRETIHPGTNTDFGRPRERFRPEFSDFADDSFTNEGPGILGEYCEGDGEPYDDFFEPCEPWEEDFQSDTCFQNPVEFGPRGMRPVRPVIQQPFRARGIRPPHIACRPPRIFQRFPRDPQRFLRPSFDMPPLRGSAPLPRGLFRPRMRPYIRPL